VLLPSIRHEMTIDVSCYVLWSLSEVFSDRKFSLIVFESQKYNNFSEAFSRKASGSGHELIHLVEYDAKTLHVPISHFHKRFHYCVSEILLFHVA
jgi:hypothetical protein